ncbi:MAG: copper-translocating P-type ATPase [Desulfuromonas sp.]|nr:MAG: copper-translocating P-type ATPase [Desulfuromonas sp.]
MNIPAAKCHHCGLPIPAAVNIRGNYQDREVRFCCQGCYGAFLIIAGSGLDKFYQQRDWPEQGVPEGVYTSEFSDNSLSPYVIPLNENFSEISFLVDGIRCATCVWLLEKVVQDEMGIEQIRVNYGSHRARVIFNHKLTNPEKIFSGISRLGYLPRPFTRNAMQESAMREQKSLLIRFGTAAFLSMQLMGYSLALYAGYFQGIDPGIRQLIQYFAAAVTIPVVFYSGWPFLSGALRSLLNRAPSMDLLIALGVLTAFSYSLYSMVAGGEVYFDTAAMIITLILMGRLLENSARNRSLSGIDKLLQLAPDTARLLKDGNVLTVQSNDLKPGDIISILPGERVPVDSEIIEGSSEFNEAVISGEALPVFHSKNENIASGSLNLTSTVNLKVVRIAAESFVSRMSRMVEEAQNRKAPVQSLADRIATFFVPFVISISAGTWAYWHFIRGDSENAILNAVAVLIVACPCALGLATPTAVLVATGRAAMSGILFRGGDILEATSRVDTIAFDKTGTLTSGVPAVTGLFPADGITPTQLLRAASIIAAGSSHPLSRAIVTYAAQNKISTAPARNVRTIPGRGLVAQLDNHEYRLGNLLFLKESQIKVNQTDDNETTEVHLAVNGVFMGSFRFFDPLRNEAATVVSSLRDNNLRTVLLTGDHKEPARIVAEQLKIDTVLSDLRPEEKASWIKEQQATGHTLIMFGDGINDAPALAQADIGCAMAGGTDIALETSDIVLTRADLGRLNSAIKIARQSLRTIRQNLFWAFSYNLVAIPLAASGLLAPVWAAAAMATSSIIVIGNSLRLDRQLKKRVANSSLRY